MSIKYEMSLWRDYPGISSIREERIETLAATDMGFGGRAKNIKLKREYNGKITLTFDIPVKYFDYTGGSSISNPFIKLIEERSKIKLWRDELWWNPFATFIKIDESTGRHIYQGKWVQGRWYDFIVTSHKEKRSKKELVYSYTCGSMFMDELSRTGYNLEFVPTSDIMSVNGMGTAHDLAERIIDGTEWSYIKTEVFPDYKEEFDSETGETKRIPVSTDQIEFSKGLNRYVYCHEVKVDSARQTEILNDLSKAGAPSGQYGFTNGKFWWKSRPEDNKKEFVYNYTKTNIITSYADKILCYTSGEMYKDASGKEPVDEAALLDSTGLWSEYMNKGTVTSVRVDDYDKGSYYRLTCSPSATEGGIFVNTGYEKNSLSAGETIVFSISLHNGLMPYLEIHDYEDYLDDTTISKYSKPRLYLDPGTYYSGVNNSNNCFECSFYLTIPKNIRRPHFIFKPRKNGDQYSQFTIKGLFIYKLVGINEEINNKIKEYLSSVSNVGFLNNDTLKSQIESISGVKKVILRYNTCTIDGVDSHIWLPVGTMAQNSFENGTEQYYIEFYAGGEYKQYYIPLKDGEHTKITSYNADKRRSISGSKSNRYTLLETVSKTFYCFSKFVVEHDGQGRIALNEDGTLKKYFTFTSVLGNNQFNGFNYGVNLENIERTIDSSALVTKVYVQNIDNQYNESGLVTIQESKYNQMKEPFFYNFNYYGIRGFLNNAQFKLDYDDMVTTVGTKNTEINQLSKEKIDLTTEKEKVEVQANTNNLLMESTKSTATNELNTIKWNRFCTKKGITAEFPNIVWSSLPDWSSNNTFDKYGEYMSKLTTGSTSTNPAEYYVCGGLSANDIASVLSAVDKLQAQYKNYKASYDAETKKLNQSGGYKDQLKEKEDKIENLLKLKNEKISSFEEKYHRYILEGQWQGSDYAEPDTYYLDATRAMSTACMPKVSYTIGAKDLSKICNPFNPNDKTWGADFIYDVGDTTYVQDKELFGSLQQKAMVASIESYIDQDKEDSIELRNFETRFEELFQSIAVAVTTLQLNENIYSRASNFTEQGTIDATILQKSFNENRNLVISSCNNSVIQDNNGITITDLGGTGDVLRAVAAGIFFSNDNGLTYTAGMTAKGMNATFITAGQLDTSKIVIRSTDTPQYSLDSQGLTAYDTTVINNARSTKIVRFDQFGLWMTENGNNFLKDWWKAASNPIQYIIDNSVFSLTHDGLNLKYEKGTTNTLTFGQLGNNLYGLRFKKNGVTTIEMNTNGEAKISNWIINSNALSCTTYDSNNKQYTVRIINTGNYYHTGNTGRAADVITIYDENKTYGDYYPFSLWKDGTLNCFNANIKGTITAIGGKIGSWEITETYLGHWDTDYTNRYYITGDPIYASSTMWSGEKQVRLFFNGKFAVDTNGSLWATGANISGKITSTEGEIGGWTINSWGLYKTTSQYQIVIRVPEGYGHDYGSTDVIVIADKTGSSTTWPFVVKSDGTLRCTRAEIKGTISAGSIIASGTQVGTSSFFEMNNGWLELGYYTGSGNSKVLSSKLGLYIDSATLKGGSSQINLIDSGITISGNTYLQGDLKVSLNKIFKWETSGVIAAKIEAHNDESARTHLTLNSLSYIDLIINDTKCLWAKYDTSNKKYGGHLSGTWTNDMGWSDIRLKNTIETLDDRYDIFFDSLQSKRYKYNNGTSNRFHTGYIAQEIVEALKYANISTQEFAGVMLVNDEELGEERWYLRRDEFVALNTWQIQKAKARISELEQRIAELEERLSN